jgi:phenylalanyl-tRNA synthetase beta chain
MKISYNWLKDYVPTNLNVEKVADLLTFCGLEVESIEVVETIKGGLKNYVVGKVLTCENHPDSDHLHLTTVNVGQETPLNIVCGAPNVAKGQKVIVAKIGAKVYSSETEYFEIKKSKLRGYVSEGMICSEQELQISNNHEGIMVIEDNNVVVGTPAKEYLNIQEDYVFEIGLTPNRSDATSHIGVGRDLVALIQTQLKENISLNLPSIEGFKIDKKENNIEIITDSIICPRYSGLTISNIEVKDSPEWLSIRLKLIGIRPINNIVDATNYVLFEIGQPLHAFDLSKIKGNRIEVKTLPKGTKFTTLDGIERELNGTEAMVCNSEGGMCMGGIYGGLDSGVTKETKSIFIESAYFNPVTIRKASKLHGLKTDASFRYERGTDPNVTIYALKRAALLIKEISGGEISSNIIDIYPNEIKQAEIDICYKSMYRLIGKTIEPSIIKTILTSLNISILEEDEKGMKLSVPTNKVDVLRECDIVEEILRIYGYNNVEIPSEVKSSLSFQKKPNTEKIQNLISDLLASNGFNEIMNNSLTKTAYYENNTDFPLEKSVNILNALSKDLGVMRQTLLYGGLETISYNINRKVNNIRIFEFGNCYNKDLEQFDNQNITKRYNEEKHLILLTTGNNNPESWQKKEEKTDFFYLKNFVINIFERLRIDTSKYLLEETNSNFLEGLQFVNRDNKKIIACYGRLKQKVGKQFDIKQDVFVADFNWNLIIKTLTNKDIKYQEVSKFPEVRRDLALVVDKTISFAEIEALAYQTEKKLLQRNISLFDVYQGDKLPEGKKQYALSFTLQDKEKTLTDNQIEAIMKKLLKGFEDKLGAKLR